MGIFSKTEKVPLKVTPKRKKRLSKAQRLLKAKALWEYEKLKELSKDYPELISSILAKDDGMNAPKSFTPADRIRRQYEADQMVKAYEMMGEDPDLSRRLAEMELVKHERELGIIPNIREVDKDEEYYYDYRQGYSNPLQETNANLHDSEVLQENKRGGDAGGFAGLLNNPAVIVVLLALLGILRNIRSKQTTQKPDTDTVCVIQTKYGPVHLTQQEYDKYMQLYGDQQQPSQESGHPAQGTTDKKDETPKQGPQKHQ
ncbi:hypothetical protein ACFLWX_02255 [Chloroflexota bacterium]